MAEQRRKQTLLSGAMVLVVATALVKIISAIYKIPITNLIGGTGMGYYSTAYKIYTPIWAISMAGLPVAVSKMISENAALGRFKDVRRIFKVSLKAFLFTGTIGTIILVGVAYPYARYIANVPEAFPVILAVAPAVFFCCVMSAYRGYYEGLRNMVPTATSQVTEAVVKLVFGLAMSYGVVRYGMGQFEAGKTVFGKVVENAEEAMAAIYPMAATAAILGVTLGTVGSLLYLMVKLRKNGFGFTREEIFFSPEPRSDRRILKGLIAIAIPIVLSSLISNISTLIDAATVQNRLASAIANDTTGIIDSMYAKSLELTGEGSITAIYLYGVLDVAETLKNMIPQITLTLGVSSLPVISQYWALNKRREIKSSIESVIRLCMLISLPAGFGMAALSQPILTLLYGASQPDIPYVVDSLVRAFGFTLVLYAFSSPLTTMLQAIGRADIPAKSFAVGVGVKIVLNYILVGNPRFNIKGAAISTIACYVIVIGINLFYLRKISRVRFNWMSIFIKPFISAALCGVTAWAGYGLLAKIGGMPRSIVTILAIAAGGIVYLLMLFLIKAISKDDVLMLPKGEKIAKVLEKYHLMG